MSKNDKPKEELDSQTPKTPPPEPEFPKCDEFTEGVKKSDTKKEDKK